MRAIKLNVLSYSFISALQCYIALSVYHWIAVIRPPGQIVLERSIAISIWRYLLLLVVFAVGFAVWLGTCSTRGRKATYLLLGAIVFIVCFVSQYTWISRYTMIGVFMLGGDSYWMKCAVSAYRDEDKISYLLPVLNGADWGWSTVERRLLKSYGPETQVHMFWLLEQHALNDNWRDIYRERREEAIIRMYNPSKGLTESESP